MKKLLSRFSIIIYVSLFLITGLVVTLFWYIQNSQKNFETIANKDLRTLELSAKIIELDKTLTTTTILAVKTNDISWKKNYDESSVELDRLFTELEQLSPEAFVSKIAVLTESANKNLLEIELKAFDAVQAGDLKYANRIIKSETYAINKEAYANGIAKINRLIREDADKKVKKQQRLGYQSEILLIVGLVLLAAFWFITFKVLSQLVKKQGLANEELKIAKEKAEANEKYLSELNKARDKLFFIITHDLNTPLNNLLSFSQFLENLIKEKDFDKIKEVTNQINQSIENTIDLRTHLMEWSQTQANKVKFHPKPLELKKIVDESINLVKLFIIQKSIKTVINIADDLKIYADKNMITTILRSLLSNAVKFSKEGGEVIVEAENSNNECVISVIDKGIGIEENLLPLLFITDINQPTTGTFNEKGAGISLNICKQFIEMHGGRIWADSSKELGTTIKFTLPLKKK